jgi:hypothetical protein
MFQCNAADPAAAHSARCTHAAKQACRRRPGRRLRLTTARSWRWPLPVRAWRTCRGRRRPPGT